MQVKIFLVAFMIGCSTLYAGSTTAANRLIAIEKYFNSFRTLKAKFTQLNPDGSQSAGSFYLWRPGRMRLNYEEVNGQKKNPRQMHIIVANGDTLYDHNAEYDETTEIPLDATPAGFILRDNIRFSGDIEVTHLQEKRGLIFLSLVKKDDPDAGTLTLVFNADPLALIEWEILDSQRVPTRVLLDAIETGVKLDARMFQVRF